MAVKQGVGGVPPLEATAEPFRGYDAAIRLAFVPLKAMKCGLARQSVGGVRCGHTPGLCPA
nr:hypothetical protein [Pleurocapsa sp. PCC 7319]